DAVQGFDRLVEGTGGTWMLCQYTPGTSLSQYIGGEASLPPDWVFWWLDRLLAGLEYLHAQTPPVVVGYLQPADLIVTKDHLMICDLGLFESMFPELASSTLETHPFRNFMAPELAYPAQPAADLFSAGAIAFWLATGDAPVHHVVEWWNDKADPSLPSLLEAALRKYRPNWPDTVTLLILRLLSPDPGQRPSAAVARQELAASVQDLRGQFCPLPSASDGLLGFARTTVRAGEEEIDAPEARESRVPQPIDLMSANEPVSTAVRLPLWKELADDMAWTVRTRRGLWRRAAALLAVLALAAVAWQAGAGSQQLSVRSGSVRRLDLRANRSGDRWVPSREATAGDTLLVGPEGASLQWVRTSLQAEHDTELWVGDLRWATCRVRLEMGQVRVETASDTVQVLFRSDTIEVKPRSIAIVALYSSPVHGSVHCSQGTVSLRTGQTVQDVAIGHTMALVADGASAVWAGTAGP
ncbi:MAG TPA: hypothetical protein VGO93_21080, partial [Candidatus Xenobia bacterium]